MSCVCWQCVSMVNAAPLAAARIARPWLQKAKPSAGAHSQNPDWQTHGLFSSIRTDPGPATLRPRAPEESVTLQLVTLTLHSVSTYAPLFASAGASVIQSFWMSVQPSVEKSASTCHVTPSDDPPESCAAAGVKYRFAFLCSS